MPLGEDVTGLLPHRAPMILLDHLVASDADSAAAEWRVPVVGPWVTDGRLDREAFLEVAAQTAAAGVGRERVRAGLEPVAGFLGGVRNLRVLRDAATGDRIVARTAVTHRFERIVRVSFSIVRDEEILCDGELTLSLGVEGSGDVAPRDHGTPA
jgi:predicted hotdog family 3-hydroxylacyl-ACP dehydratase